MACQNELGTAPTSDIPPFAKPLAPYLKTRQEALRIRQALTGYLRSHISFVDNDPDHPDCPGQSHLSLCVPDNAVSDVRRIPAEFTGLRREYLEALQANVAARKQQQSISEKLSAERSEDASAGRLPDSSLELQAYLRLVRDRRRYAKLQTFDHYLRELRACDTPRPEDFESQDGRNQLILPEESEQGHANNAAGGDVEGLVHSLEKAVVRAKSQVYREKRLFEDLKTRAVSEGRWMQDPVPAVKAAALQRIRDELVQWVEERLVGTGNSEEAPVQELPAEEIEESARILEEQRLRIQQQYATYTEARKSLLEAAARACQPLAAASTKPSQRSLETKAHSKEEALSIEPLEVLSYATGVLHPVSKTQRSLALQKFYLSGLLAKEKNTTLRMLNRLSDESHLLPEYPILARQPRFKHAAAALNSRLATNQPEPTQQDHIVNMADSWAFASAAAGSNEKEYVEQKVVEGNEHAEKAHQELQKVYNLLNQDIEEAIGDDQSQDQKDNDIWAHEARSTKSSARLSRTDRRSKGPWTRLNGKIGVAD